MGFSHVHGEEAALREESCAEYQEDACRRHVRRVARALQPDQAVPLVRLRTPIHDHDQDVPHDLDDG